jgi:hypothetical protein
MVEITPRAAELLRQIRSGLQDITNEGRGDKTLPLTASAGTLVAQFDLCRWT